MSLVFMFSLFNEITFVEGDTIGGERVETDLVEFKVGLEVLKSLAEVASCGG